MDNSFAKFAIEFDKKLLESSIEKQNPSPIIKRLPINKNVGQGIKEAYNFVLGNYGYTQAVQKILNEYGDLQIRYAQVMRTPVKKIWTEILKNISVNFKAKLKDSDYDTLYHLFIVFSLSDGTKLLVEKNAVINIVVNPKVPSNAEKVYVSIFKKLSINELLNTSHKQLGDKAFFVYKANTWNCQHFIFNLLKHSGITSPELDEFILQSVAQLFNPTLSKFSRVLTDIGGFSEMLLK